MGFLADPAFEAGSVRVSDLALCQLRLQNDARFPWLILIPRVDNAVEIEDLDADQRQQLLDEILIAGEVVRHLGADMGVPVEKLNIGALGNITRQLHIHVIGRRASDPVWPGPVWGSPAGPPLQDLQTRIAALLACLSGICRSEPFPP